MISFMLVAISGIMTASNESWINNSLTLKVNAKVNLVASNESRYRTLTFSDGPFLKNWQAGFTYKLPKNFSLGIAYKRENTEKSTYLLTENRITFDAGWKTKFSSKCAFDIRLRTEVRGFEKDLGTNHLRFRLRLRVKTKMALGNIKMSPYIAFEPFGDTKNDEINRYRLYIGTGITLTKNASWAVKYVRQGTKDKETLHALVTGINLKF